MYFITGLTMGFIIGILIMWFKKGEPEDKPPEKSEPDGRFEATRRERELRAEGYRNIMNYLCRHGGDE